MTVVKAIVIEAGNPEVKIIEQLDASLESMQAIVGGWLEAVPLTPNIILWINEEGKMMDLEPNFALTAPNGKALDIIVGNVVITGVDIAGNTSSLSDSDILMIQDHFINRVTLKMF